MTIPIIVFRVIHAIFGTGSYWPYLIPTMVCHLGIVGDGPALEPARRRDGVDGHDPRRDAAVFGSGWENIVFAIQLVYNLSLLAFLVQLVLIDHDGPPESARRHRRRRRAGRRGVVGFRAVLHRRDAAVHGHAASLDGCGDRHPPHHRRLGMVVVGLGPGPGQTDMYE